MDNKIIGEILMKEKYGSTSRKINYVKSGENEIIVVENNRYSDITNWFVEIFLPQGYPDSVSKDYISYQIWDTAQAFCSTITGILATHEVLRGIGVGDANATSLSATITWVVKDGFGHLGRILFAYTHGSYLDAYSKKWRIYADTLNDAAMCIEIALPLFKNHTTRILCLSTIMKAIVGVAGGATRAAMTQHHAVRGNMADVAAKDSAQETAVNLTGSIVALIIITLFGNNYGVLLFFVFMMLFHIMFNYMAVRAVCLRTFNEPRFLQTINLYLRKEEISTPCKINRLEPIMFYMLGTNLLDLKLCGFHIRMGESIKLFMTNHPNYSYLKYTKEVYSHRNYLIIPNINTRIMHVLMKEKATNDDMLHAYFHSVLLAIIVCAINNVPLSIYEDLNDSRPFGEVCRTLQEAEWCRELVPTSDKLDDDRFKYNPSRELLNYVDNITKKEWTLVKTGLIQTGWDVSRNLLMVNEWRIEDDISPNIIEASCESKSSKSTTSSGNFAEIKEPNDIPKPISLKAEKIE